MGYLEANPSFKLNYQQGGESRLKGFADSDWGNSVSRRSTTGLLARYNKCIVQWRSKLQKIISLSTAEAEYYTASEMASAGRPKPTSAGVQATKSESPQAR